MHLLGSNPKADTESKRATVEAMRAVRLQTCDSVRHQLLAVVNDKQEWLSFTVCVNALTISSARPGVLCLRPLPRCAWDERQASAPQPPDLDQDGAGDMKSNEGREGGSVSHRITLASQRPCAKQQTHSARCDSATRTPFFLGRISLELKLGAAVIWVILGFKCS